MGNLRSLGLSGAPNARDLGGLVTSDGRTVRPGLVFRAPALGRLTDEDVSSLDRLGLTDLLDLRHGSEIDTAPPDRLPAGPAGSRSGGATSISLPCRRSSRSVRPNRPSAATSASVSRPSAGAR